MLQSQIVCCSCDECPPGRASPFPRQFDCALCEVCLLNTAIPLALLIKFISVVGGIVQQHLWSSFMHSLPIWFLRTNTRLGILLEMSYWHCGILAWTRTMPSQSTPQLLISLI